MAGVAVDVVVTVAVDCCMVGNGGGDGGRCSTGTLAASMAFSGFGGGGGSMSSPETPTLMTG